MKQSVTLLLFLLLLGLPLVLVLGSAYSGSSYPIENRTIQNLDFLDHSVNEVEVLFFGYTGCASICPTSLAKLSSVLESTERIGATFVEIRTGSEKPVPNAAVYSSRFSEKIRGYNPGENELRRLSHDFALRIYQNTRNSNLISHTDHFFVLTKEDQNWTIFRVMNNESDETLIRSVLEEATLRIS